MAFSKMLIGGAAALALVLGTTGCSMFDDDDASLEMFKVKGDDGAARVSGSGAGGFDANAGNANINSMGGINGGSGANAGAGEWNNAAPGPYDDFGRPIPGVTLPTVYFSFDSSRIGSSEAPKLDEIASYLSSTPGTGVVIEAIATAAEAMSTTVRSANAELLRQRSIWFSTALRNPASAPSVTERNAPPSRVTTRLPGPRTAATNLLRSHLTSN